jgi:hypothetical protein
MSLASAFFLLICVVQQNLILTHINLANVVFSVAMSAQFCVKVLEYHLLKSDFIAKDPKRFSLTLTS